MKSIKLRWRTSRRMLGLLALLLGGLVSSGEPEAYGLDSNRYLEEWRWGRFGEESGLPSTDVFNLIESSGGTMWAATARGLAWFDGFKWRPIEIEGAPKLGHISNLTADAKDRIIVLTGGAIYRGDRTGFKRIRPVSKEQEELSIRSVLPVKEDQLMVVTDNGRLFIWNDSSTHQISLPEGLAASNFKSSRDGSVWLSNPAGTYRWSGNQWVHHVDIPTNYLRTDDRGNVLATTVDLPSRQVWTWGPGESPQRVEAAHGWVVTSGDLANNGDAILARTTGEILVRDRDEWSSLALIPRELQEIHAIRFQQNGDLWTVTRHGLYLCRRSLSRWSQWKLDRPHVHALLRTSRGQLLAAHTGGITVIYPDGKHERLAGADGVSFGALTGLAEDSDGGIWVSSGSSFNGAYRLHNGSWRYYGTDDGLPDARIHKIVKDRRGRLWFLGISPQHPAPPDRPEPGAYLLDEGVFTRWGQPEGLLTGRVYDFAEGVDGSYWFGTWGGLSRWHQGEWTHWTHHDGLRINRVFALAAGDDGRVWFGHQSIGLGYIDEHDVPVYVNMALNLNNSGVWDLQFDSAGSLWIGTDRGLGRYQDGVYCAFDTSTGLSNPRLWPVLPEREKVYVGTLGGGLNALDLSEADNPAPQVSIHPPLTSDNQIIIDWDVHSFQAEQSPGNVQTRYRVDDSPWSSWSTTHKAILPKQVYGDHTIAVQAMSLFGKVDPEGTTLTFHNQPPVLRSPPFTEPWRWSHFTAQDGLPSNRVSDVCESRDGTIWAATAAGLAWYDGFVWHAMGSEDGIPKRTCRRIVPDRESGILVTIDGNLYRGDRHGFRQVPIPPESEAQHVLVAAPAHSAGLLLLGLDVQTQQLVWSTLIDGVLTEIRDARGIEPAALDTQWGVSEVEIWGRIGAMFNRWGEGAWRRVPAPRDLPEQTDPEPRIDAEGFLWIEHAVQFRGLWEWRSGHQPRNVLPVEFGRIEALAMDAEGSVIAVTGSGVVHLRQKGSWYELSPVPSQFSGARSLQFGSNGDLWVASHSGVSLYRSTDRFWRYWKNHAERSSNFVSEIVQASDGRIWIATSDGIEIRSPSAPVERFSRINGIDVRHSTGLAQDRDGNIWLSSGSAYEGAFRFDGTTWDHFGPQEGLPGLRHKVRIDRRGRPWFLGLNTASSGNALEGTGAAVYDGGKFAHWTTAEGLIHNRVFAFAEGLNGELWFGTLGGLSRWHAGEWTHWTPTSGRRSAKIWTLAVDENNVLWFGDNSNSLGMLRTGDPEYIATIGGLAINRIGDVRSDPRGGIWATYPGGVLRIKGDRRYSISASLGIAHPNLWPILPTQDNVYFGTLGNGTAILDRQVLDDVPLRIHVEEPTIQKESATLRWRAVAREGLINQEDIDTRYRVDDGVWSDWSLEHSAILADALGSHSLTVQARIRFADSTPTERRITFELPLPVHRQPLFLALVMGSALAIGSLIVIMTIRWRRHRAALREKQDLLDAIVERTADAIAVTDLNGRFVFLNRAAARRFNKPVHKLLGQMELDFYPEGAAARIQADDRRLLAEDGREPDAYSFENTIEDGGIPRTYIATKTVLRDDQGNASAIVGVAHDITDRKQFEEEIRQFNEELEQRVADRTSELRKSEAILTEAQEIAHLGSWELDLEQNELSWSDEVYLIFGLNSHKFEATYDEFIDAVHPEDRAFVIKAYNESLNNDVPYDITHRIVRPDGEVRFVHERCNHTRNDVGNVIRSVGIVWDITERKQAEAAIIRAKEEWERTFDAVPDLVAIIDKDHRIVRANKAMADRMGLAIEECVGKHCYGVAHGTTEPHVDMLKDKQCHVAELCEPRLGGDFIVSASPLYDSDGELLGSVHIARDITDRKRAEEERTQLEEQLRHAQKMDAIGQLAAGVAHEFNNLLVGILSNVELLEIQGLDLSNTFRQPLSEIRMSGERASVLTRQLLSFSEKKKIAVVLVNLNESVSRCEGMLRRLLGERIELETSLAPNLGLIMADQAIMEQALLNLTINARDAMPVGGRLTIRTASVFLDNVRVLDKPDVREGSYIELTVADTGVGMTAEIVERIFEPFYTTKPTGQGTGLGLSTVFGDISQMGGHIIVDSKVGEGTVFRLLVPQAEDVTELSNTDTKSSADTQRDGNETILVCDDEEIVLNAISCLLETGGYKVLRSKSGSDALSIATAYNGQIDLLLTDVMMPEMNGPEIANKLKSTRQSMKVMYMSGYPSDILDAGDAGFLQKPPMGDSLFRSVREMLD